MESDRIEKTYRINGDTIQVMGSVFRDERGCYKLNMKYRKLDSNEEMRRAVTFDQLVGRRTNDHWKEDDPWMKTELVLNGPGKSKLKKKITRFLQSQFSR